MLSSNDRAVCTRPREGLPPAPMDSQNGRYLIELPQVQSHVAFSWGLGYGRECEYSKSQPLFSHGLSNLGFLWQLILPVSTVNLLVL